MKLKRKINLFVKLFTFLNDKDGPYLSCTGKACQLPNLSIRYQAFLFDLISINTEMFIITLIYEKKGIKILGF